MRINQAAHSKKMLQSVNLGEWSRGDDDVTHYSLKSPEPILFKPGLEPKRGVVYITVENHCQSFAII